MTDDVAPVRHRVVVRARAGEPAGDVEGRELAHRNDLVAAASERAEGRDEHRDDARVVGWDAREARPVVGARAGPRPAEDARPHALFQLTDRTARLHRDAVPRLRGRPERRGGRRAGGALVDRVERGAPLLDLAAQVGQVRVAVDGLVLAAAGDAQLDERVRDALRDLGFPATAMRTTRSWVVPLAKEFAPGTPLSRISTCLTGPLRSAVEENVRWMTPNVPRHLFPPVVVQLLPETVPLVSSHLSSTP